MFCVSVLFLLQVTSTNRRHVQTPSIYFSLTLLGKSERVCGNYGRDMDSKVFEPIEENHRSHVTSNPSIPITTYLQDKCDRACDTPGRGKGRKVSDLLGEDVLEAPSKTVHFSEAQKASWTYGTMGAGADLARTVWPEQELVFSSQQKSLLEAEGTTTHELGPPNRVPRTILSQHPVDCLLIDDCNIEIWTPWISSVPTNQRPEAILLFTQAIHLEKESGAASQVHRKLLKKLGYSINFWLMEACDFGAAVSQLRLGVLYTKETSENQLAPQQPIPNYLPARPMSNLLMPFGVPAAAWTKMVPNSSGGHQRCLPCVSTSGFGRAPIFDPQGPMPDALDSWVQVEKGIRRLQVEELAKAKGVPKEWEPTSRKKRKLWRTVVGQLTVLHLWTATMDSLGNWMRARSPRETSNSADQAHATSINRPGKLPPPTWENPVSDALEWEVPDLKDGSDWFKARMQTLRLAIQNLPNREQHLKDGIQALARHRLNYTTEGPQQLQLLWWEFPEEHWEPLREGCSMNFLISPTGELQMNSEMDEAGKVIAGRFVDELVKLGVLLPADGELRANCPLFCVDKASQPGEKRCIADCKKGGQNACMGQDPTYLVRNDEILPQLYEGGWSAIADASKQFHNFPTKPDERRYLGCIHPVTGVELVYAGLPMGTS